MAEQFSDRCLNDHCSTARRMGEPACASLGALGVGRCPGMATVHGERMCSLPGEIVEHLAGDYPEIPITMLGFVARGVTHLHVSPGDIPVPSPANPAASIEAWGGLVRRLDEQYFPEQHYNPVELPAEQQVIPQGGA